MARRHTSRKRGCRSREVKPNAEDAPLTGDVSQREQKHKLLDSPHLLELAELTGKTNYQARANLLESLFHFTALPRKFVFKEASALTLQESNAAEAAGFSKVSKATQSLLAAIAGLSADSQEGLQDLLHDVADDAPRLANIRRRLEILSEAASLRAVRLDHLIPRKKGRPEQFNLHLLVFGLANAYVANSGEPFTYYRQKKDSRTNEAPNHDPISAGHQFVWHAIEFFRETSILPKRLFPAATPRAIATECERVAHRLKKDLRNHLAGERQGF